MKGEGSLEKAKNRSGRYGPVLGLFNEVSNVSARVYKLRADTCLAYLIVSMLLAEASVRIE